MPPGSLVQQARRRMDELVKRAIGLTEQKTRSVSSVPWKTDEPWKQAWHVYAPSKRQWEATETGPSQLQPHQPTQPTQSQPSPSTNQRLALYSWNIDFMLPFPDSRMHKAVRHLESLIKQEREEGTAAIVFLQECVESDLARLAADPWIQQTFAITDTSTEHWQSGHYGTNTLIDNRLDVRDVCRVHYEKTRMQRDGLFVDISFPSQSGGHKTIRLCNTHLESLALEPPLRPAQIELCAKYMHASEVDFAAAAGDFNAIQDFDKQLHSDNGLKDAYLELGGSEDDAEGGHTWGQQAATSQRERFGTSRMDKVFFCGGAMTCVSFERIGGGVEVEDKRSGRRLSSLGLIGRGSRIIWV